VVSHDPVAEQMQALEAFHREVDEAPKDKKRQMHGYMPSEPEVLIDAGLKAIQMDAQEIMEVTEEAKAFTTDRAKAIHFIPNGVSVDVEVESPESGSYSREVEAEIEGKVPQRVGLNVTYVQDALKSIGGETVTVHLGESPIDATLWTSDRGECRVVIMPVRV
jgi:DNA polymerase III sliding clamp (beta) subunit (PCNA family)